MNDGNLDQTLIERARSGDATAFRQIVERHQVAVAATVIGMLGPGDEADDVGQETFIRLYRSLHRFRGDSALRTYLTKIAMNLSLNALKKRKRTSGRTLRLDTTDSGVARIEPAAPGGGAEEALERGDRKRAVRAAIDGLDVKHREVVVLRMMDGLSTKETASVLRIPEGTVLSRLSRGLKKLETDLEDWMNEQ